MLTLATAVSLAIPAGAATHVDARAFFAAHPQVTVQSYVVTEAGGDGGYVEIVYDDVKAGVALQFGTQDPDATIDEIAHNTATSEDAQIVHHRKGRAYHFKARRNKVERTSTDRALTLRSVRRHLHLRG